MPITKDQVIGGIQITLVGLLMWMMLTLLTGCAPTAMPKEFGQATKAFFASALDQAVWSDIMGESDGHVINPGVHVGAGIMYVAYARLEGVDGDIRLRAEGAGSGELTSEARSTILGLLGNDRDVFDRVMEVIDATRAPPVPPPAE